MSNKRRVFGYKGTKLRTPVQKAVEIREEVLSLLEDANSSLSIERQITPRAAFTVVYRSLDASRGFAFHRRKDAALSELSNFIKAANGDFIQSSFTRHADLLPIGHPFSTKSHAMTASVYNMTHVRWLVSDSRVSDEMKPLMASALILAEDSAEYKYAVARLSATYGSLDILEALTAAGDGNSYLARRARAMRQRRDRKGRFAFMGGGVRALLRKLDGSVHWLNGNVAGVSEDGNNFDVELPDGRFAKIDAHAAENLKAVLPDSQGSVDGISDRAATYDSSDSGYILDEKNLSFVDAPGYWTVDPTPRAANEKAFLEPDGMFRIVQTKNQDGSVSYQAERLNGDVLGQGKTFSEAERHTALDAAGGDAALIDTPPLEEVVSGLKQISADNGAADIKNIVDKAVNMLGGGSADDGEKPAELADRLERVAKSIDDGKFPADRAGYADDLRDAANALRAQAKGAKFKEAKASLRGQQRQNDAALPEGAYKVDTGDYEPQGGYFFDERDPSDYTDEPSQLASKFTKKDLQNGLTRAVLGKNFADNGIVTPDGVAEMGFNDGTGYVPAEALYHALKEKNVNADNILDAIHRVGNKRLAEKANQTPEATLPEKSQTSETTLPESDIADIIDSIITPDDITSIQNEDDVTPAESNHTLDEASTPEEDAQQNELPALLQGLTDSEIQDFIDNGYNHVPYLPNNEDIQMPEGYNTLDPNPVMLEDIVTVEEGDNNNNEGYPVGWTNDPYWIAQNYNTDDLKDQLRYALEPHNDEPGHGMLSIVDENGDEFTAYVAGENIRDALQLQGVDTNEFIQSVADEGFQAGDTSGNFPSTSEIDAMIKGEGIDINAEIYGTPPAEVLPQILRDRGREGLNPQTKGDDLQKIGIEEGTTPKPAAAPAGGGGGGGGGGGVNGNPPTPPNSGGGGGGNNPPTPPDGSEPTTPSSSTPPKGPEPITPKTRNQAIIDKVREQGGMSVKPLDGSEPTDGYMVAVQGFNREIPADQFFGDGGVDALEQYIEDHLDQLSGSDIYLGLWHDEKNGEVVLDIAQKFDNRDDAIQAGKDRNQQSIYDIVAQEEIPTGGSGDRAANEEAGSGTGKSTSQPEGNDSGTTPGMGGEPPRQDGGAGEQRVTATKPLPAPRDIPVEDLREGDVVALDQMYDGKKNPPGLYIVSDAEVTSVRTGGENVPEGSVYFKPANAETEEKLRQWLQSDAANDSFFNAEEQSDGSIVVSISAIDEPNDYAYYGNKDRLISQGVLQPAASEQAEVRPGFDKNGNMVWADPQTSKETGLTSATSGDPAPLNIIQDPPSDGFASEQEAQLVEDNYQPSLPSQPAAITRGEFHARDLQPGDVVARDGFVIEEVGTERNADDKIVIKGYYPGHPTQEKLWKHFAKIEAVRGVDTANLPEKGDLPELHKPVASKYANGINDPQFMLDQAAYRGRLAAAKARWGNAPDVAKDDFNPESDPHRVTVSGASLKPGDITVDPAKGNFVVTKVFSDENTKDGFVSIEGYYPGHQPQRKEWRNSTKFDVYRNVELPAQGDLPEFHQPHGISPNGKWFPINREKDPQGHAEYDRLISEAAARFNPPADVPQVEDYSDTPENPNAPKPKAIKKPTYPNRPPGDPLAQGEFAAIVREANGDPAKLKELLKGRELIFFDFETTGLSPENDGVWQIGAVKVVDGKVVERFNVYADPNKSVDPALVAKLNQVDPDGNPITDEFLKQQLSRNEAFQQFLQFAGANPLLVGQNTKFDRSFLENILSQEGIDMNPAGYFDNQAIARALHADLPEKERPKNADGSKDSNSLGDLARHYGVDMQHHDAASDSEATFEVLFKMLDRMTETGKGLGVLNVENMQKKHEAEVADYEKKLADYKQKLAEYEAAKAVKDAMNNQPVNLDEVVANVEKPLPNINNENVGDVAGTGAPELPEDSLNENIYVDVAPATNFPDGKMRLATADWVLDPANAREIPRSDVRMKDLRPGDFMFGKDGNGIFQVVSVQEGEEFGLAPGKVRVYRVNIADGKGHNIEYFRNMKLDGVRRPIDPNALAFGDDKNPLGDPSLDRVTSSADIPATSGKKDVIRLPFGYRLEVAHTNEPQSDRNVFNFDAVLKDENGNEIWNRSVMVGDVGKAISNAKSDALKMLQGDEGFRAKMDAAAQQLNAVKDAFKNIGFFRGTPPINEANVPRVIEHDQKPETGLHADTTLTENGDGTMSSVTQVKDDEGNVVAENTATVNTPEEGQVEGEKFLNGVSDAIETGMQDVQTEEPKNTTPANVVPPSRIVAGDGFRGVDGVYRLNIREINNPDGSQRFEVVAIGVDENGFPDMIPEAGGLFNNRADAENALQQNGQILRLIGLEGLNPPIFGDHLQKIGIEEGTTPKPAAAPAGGGGGGGGGGGVNGNPPTPPGGGGGGNNPPTPPNSGGGGGGNNPPTPPDGSEPTTPSSSTPRKPTLRPALPTNAQEAGIPRRSTPKTKKERNNNQKANPRPQARKGRKAPVFYKKFRGMFHDINGVPVNVGDDVVHVAGDPRTEDKPHNIKWRDRGVGRVVSRREKIGRKRFDRSEKEDVDYFGYVLVKFENEKKPLVVAARMLRNLNPNAVENADNNIKDINEDDAPLQQVVVSDWANIENALKDFGLQKDDPWVWKKEPGKKGEWVQVEGFKANARQQDVSIRKDGDKYIVGLHEENVHGQRRVADLQSFDNAEEAVNFFMAEVHNRRYDKNEKPYPKWDGGAPSESTPNASESPSSPSSPDAPQGDNSKNYSPDDFANHPNWNEGPNGMATNSVTGDIVDYSNNPADMGWFAITEDADGKAIKLGFSKTRKGALDAIVEYRNGGEPQAPAAEAPNTPETPGVPPAVNVGRNALQPVEGDNSKNYSPDDFENHPNWDNWNDGRPLINGAASNSKTGDMVAHAANKGWYAVTDSADGKVIRLGYFKTRKEALDAIVENRNEGEPQAPAPTPTPTPTPITEAPVGNIVDIDPSSPDVRQAFENAIQNKDTVVFNYNGTDRVGIPLEIKQGKGDNVNVMILHDDGAAKWYTMSKMKARQGDVPQNPVPVENIATDVPAPAAPAAPAAPVAPAAPSKNKIEDVKFPQSTDELSRENLINFANELANAAKDDRGYFKGQWQDKHRENFIDHFRMAFFSFLKDNPRDNLSVLDVNLYYLQMAKEYAEKNKRKDLVAKISKLQRLIGQERARIEFEKHQELNDALDAVDISQFDAPAGTVDAVDFNKIKQGLFDVFSAAPNLDDPLANIHDKNVVRAVAVAAEKIDKEGSLSRDGIASLRDVFKSAGSDPNRPAYKRYADKLDTLLAHYDKAAIRQPLPEMGAINESKIDPVALQQERINNRENMVEGVQGLFDDAAIDNDPYMSIFADELKAFFADDTAKPMSSLSFKAQIVVNKSISKRLKNKEVTGEDLKKHVMLLAALDTERKAYQKSRVTVGSIGEKILDVDASELYTRIREAERNNRDRNNPNHIGTLEINGENFVVKSSDPGGGNAGINSTFFLIHEDSGQFFVFKKEENKDTADGEVAGALLAQALGVNGHTVVQRFKKGNDYGRYILVTGAGDGLSLDKAPVNMYESSISQKDLANKGGIADIIRFWVLDAVLYNSDRHGKNYMVAPINNFGIGGAEDSIQILPIDHGRVCLYYSPGRMQSPLQQKSNYSHVSGAKVVGALRDIIGGDATKQVADISIQQAIQFFERELPPGANLSPGSVEEIVSRLKTMLTVNADRWDMM